MTKLSLEDAPEPLSATVTFLEMAEQPKHYPPLPVGHQLALLRAKDPPLHFYRYLQDRVGRRWHWVNTLRLDDEALSQRLADPDHELRVLYSDGVPAGFFEIAHAPPASAELAYFGLMDHAVGTGIGRWFLGAAIEAAWARSPQTVRVQTCTLDHPVALPLYQKMGFTPVGQSTETVRPMTQNERAMSVMR